jgi:hypothetical protein
MRDAGLARVVDRRRGLWLVWTPTAVVVEHVPPPMPPKKTQEWLDARALRGGLQRTLNATIEEVEMLRAHVAIVEKRNTKGAAATELLALRSDLAHAVSCWVTTCVRCARLRERSDEMGAAVLLTSTESSELADLRELRKRAVDVIDAHRISGVGAMQRRVNAIGCLARALATIERPS